MTALAAKSLRAVEVIRELIPTHGWILEVRVVEEAIGRGVSKRAAAATLLLLACGEIEADKRGNQMWIRWRSGR